MGIIGRDTLVGQADWKSACGRMKKSHKNFDGNGLVNCNLLSL